MFTSCFLFSRILLDDFPLLSMCFKVKPRVIAKPFNVLQGMMLCGSLVCEFGGVKITLLCCLEKTRVGKTCAMVGKMWCSEVEKESCDDMFLPLFAEKRF